MFRRAPGPPQDVCAAVWTGGELAFGCTIPLQGGMRIRTRLTIQGATLKGRWGPRLTVAAQIDGQHVVPAAYEECRVREHRLARVITTGSDDQGTASAEETTGMSRGCRSAVA